MFYPTEPISFEEIINILERSWDTMSIECSGNVLKMEICRFELNVMPDFSPENDLIKIITPLRTITLHTWSGSPFLYEENGEESSYEQWEQGFYEVIHKITKFIYDRSRNIFRLF